MGYAGNLWLTTEAINPLYVGAYAIGPYQRPATTPSGSTQMMVGQSELPGYVSAFWDTVADAAATCSSNDGSEGGSCCRRPEWMVDGVAMRCGAYLVVECDSTGRTELDAGDDGGQ